MNRQLSSKRSLIGLIVATVLAGCASSSGIDDCSTGSIDLPNSSCMDLTQVGDAGIRASIESQIRRTVTAVSAAIPVQDLRITVIPDPAQVIPEIGLGGFAPSESVVRLFVDTGRPDIEDVIRDELFPLLAHELHHAARWRAVGYGATLFQAAISEGLADHFSMEIAGVTAPLWSKALTAAELEEWMPIVTARRSGAYNHSAWFHGTDPDIPRWTGYATGFELTRQYLDTNPGRSASSLVGEPASTFVP